MFYIDPSGLCGVGFGDNNAFGGDGLGDGDGSEFSFTELGVNLGGDSGGRPKQYTQELGDSIPDGARIAQPQDIPK